MTDCEGFSSGQAIEPFILLVDDDEPSLNQLRQVMTQAGHRCVTALSGSDAQVACRGARAPQVVVTDLCMPGIDGQALGLWLRHHYPGVPIVLITAQNLDAEQSRDLHRTFDEILFKPLDPDALLGKLSAMVPESAAGPSATSHP